MPVIFCVLCLDEEECLDHLFLRCVVSKKIWRGIFVWFGMDEVSFANYIDAFNFHYDVFHKFFSSSKATTTWLATCRSIWLGRIRILFRSSVVNVDEIVVSYKLLSWNWLVIGNMDITLCSFMDWFVSPLSCLNSRWLVLFVCKGWVPLVLIC